MLLLWIPIVFTGATFVASVFLKKAIWRNTEGFIQEKSHFNVKCVVRRLLDEAKWSCTTGSRIRASARFSVPIVPRAFRGVPFTIIYTYSFDLNALIC